MSELIYGRSIEEVRGAKWSTNELVKKSSREKDGGNNDDDKGTADGLLADIVVSLTLLCLDTAMMPSKRTSRDERGHQVMCASFKGT